MAEPPPKSRNRGCLLAGAVGIAAVALIVVSCSVRDALWRQPRPFDQVVWRDEAGNVCGRSARHAMAAEVRDVLLRQRPARSDVVALLGPPCFTRNNGAWWTLGMAPGIPVSDDCGLQVEFGADDRVSNVVLAHEAE